MTNKADIYPQGAEEIEKVCSETGIALVGQIPFDPTVTSAMLNGEPVTVYQPSAPASQALTSIWQTVFRKLVPLGDKFVYS